MASKTKRSQPFYEQVANQRPRDTVEDAEYEDSCGYDPEWRQTVIQPPPSWLPAISSGGTHSDGGERSGRSTSSASRRGPQTRSQSHDAVTLPPHSRNSHSGAEDDVSSAPSIFSSSESSVRKGRKGSSKKDDDVSDDAPNLERKHSSRSGSFRVRKDGSTRSYPIDSLFKRGSSSKSLSRHSSKKGSFHQRPEPLSSGNTTASTSNRGGKRVEAPAQGGARPKVVPRPVPPPRQQPPPTRRPNSNDGYDDDEDAAAPSDDHQSSSRSEGSDTATMPPPPPSTLPPPPAGGILQPSPSFMRRHTTSPQQQGYHGYDYNPQRYTLPGYESPGYGGQPLAFAQGRDYGLRLNAAQGRPLPLPLPATESTAGAVEARPSTHPPLDDDVDPSPSLPQRKLSMVQQRVDYYNRRSSGEEDPGLLDPTALRPLPQKQQQLEADVITVTPPPSVAAVEPEMAAETLKSPTKAVSPEGVSPGVSPSPAGGGLVRSSSILVKKSSFKNREQLVNEDDEIVVPSESPRALKRRVSFAMALEEVKH